MNAASFTPLTNWAGNVIFQARSLHRPGTVEEVQEIVARARNIRVLGARHSFNSIADASELITLSGLTPQVVLDRAASTVSFNAGLTYGDLATMLDAEGLALHNLPSLLDVSVAGALATATHGSGDGIGCLATSVAAMELITSSGDVIRASRGDTDFDGLVVGLGALGVVVRIMRLSTTKMPNCANPETRTS